MTDKSAVINESLVLKCINGRDKVVDGTDKEETKAENRSINDLDFAEIRNLALSFESVCKIDNLTNFRNLVKLSLDNNKITKIENLDSLVKLKWLDLSFNQITKIEGLDRLVDLTDLTLFHNNISVIEGLQHCKKLSVLSLGHNRIKKLENVKMLRSFPELKVVNLAGNPMCTDSDYKYFSIAYLKSIRYLDYQLVEKRDMVAAREQFQDFLQELEEKESLEEKSGEMRKTQAEHLSKIQDANLETVDLLLQSMFKEDTEHEKLKYLPFMQALLDDFQNKYSAMSEEFKTDVLAVNAEMKSEMKSFDSTLSSVREENTERAIQLNLAFKKKKKHAIRSIKMGPSALSNEERADLLSELLRKSDELKTQQLALESSTVEDFEELMTHFEIRFDAIKSKLLDKYQAFFRKVEDAENSHSEVLTNKIADLIERYYKEDGDLVVDENVAILLKDKESLMTSAVTSNDIHIGKLLSAEDEMRECLSKRCKKILEQIHTTEKSRNRSRVIEIGNFYESATEEISSLN